jgi:hypothetical protein
MAITARVTAALVALTFVASACTGSPPAKPSLSVQPGGADSGTAGPDGLAVQHGGDHPGAAVLAGDAASPSGVAFIPTLADALADVPSYWHHCHAPGPQSSVLECVLGDTSGTPKKVIALVGDSATGAWMVPLDVIGKARHWKIITILHSLCAWTATMTLQVLLSPGPYTACHTWGANAQRLLLTKIKPDVVISSDRPQLHTPAVPGGGTAALVAVGRGMATYWRQLIAHHISVVAIRETPEPGHNMPHCLTTKSARACSTSRAKAIAPITPVTVADRAVQGRETLIDMNNFICSTLCTPIVGNVLVYRDVHHLTRTFSLTLTPYLERQLLKVPALANG